MGIMQGWLVLPVYVPVAWLMLYCHQQNASSKITPFWRNVCIGIFFRILILKHELLDIEYMMHSLINAVLIFCHCMASEDHCKVLTVCVKIWIPIAVYLFVCFWGGRASVLFCTDKDNKYQNKFSEIVWTKWFWFCVITWWRGKPFLIYVTYKLPPKIIPLYFYKFMF